MLVLTRKLGEKIVLNNNIVVTVLSVKGGRIRLGIEAPPGVHIARGELQQRTDRATDPVQESELAESY